MTLLSASITLVFGLIADILGRIFSTFRMMNVKIACSTLANLQILSNFIAQWQLDLQLLSGLLLAVQIGRAENLQLLEIKFPYFNCLSHEKSLTLHLCKMYEKEVISEG